jgi:hypothetical protein
LTPSYSKKYKISRKNFAYILMTLLSGLMNNRKLTVGVTVLAMLTLAGISAATLVGSQPSYGRQPDPIGRQAPIVTSGDNLYIAWWTNKTGNDEVMFRASTDGGKTLGDKINLSNSTKSESQDAQIEASGDRVFVTWWERNATNNEPVLRISNDNGKTFGPLLKLAANGTIGSSGGG